MKALAELLVGLGWNVSGSDMATGAIVERMRATGLRVHGGHDQNFLPAQCDVLVHSPAVGADNPERVEAARRGVRQLSLPQMLGTLTAGRTSIAVAGTHGKSTTTAMIASILRAAGREPAAAFGAELCDSGRSGWAGDGRVFVVEACEYQRNFLHLRPSHGLILGVEHDHFDCYPTPAAVGAAFAEFAASVPQAGTLLVNGDCAASVAAATATGANVVAFSANDAGESAHDGGYRAADLRPLPGGSRFRVFCDGNYLTELALRVPGSHNVANATAAAAICHELGVCAADIREGLYEFRGIRRRFENVGSWRGRQLIDDYAHHPTAVRAVLDTARQQYPCRRLWAAFQPHQISRTQALLPEFAAALALADAVLLLPVFAARETQSKVATDPAATLATAISAYATPARFVPSLDLLADAVDDATRPGDVLVTMGAGDIDRVHHEFSRRLRRHHAA